MENVVKRIVIEKLYDIYDYDIEFKESGITLITGPNGYGKTTILNIIKNALDRNFWYFYDVLFTSIKIHWGDDSILSFTKVPSGQKKIQQESLFDDEVTITLEPNDENSDLVSFDVKIVHTDKNDKVLDNTILNGRKFTSLIERWLRFTRIGKGGSYQSQVSFEIMPEDAIHLTRLDKDLNRKFSDLKMFAQQCNALFVKQQRILEEASDAQDGIGSSQKYTVTKLVKQLKELYGNQKNLYVEKSQLIDSTLTERLIEGNYTKYSAEEYNKKTRELEAKIENFKKFGLVDEQFKMVRDFNEDLVATLSLHIDDLDKKFSVYDDFYDKLNRFDQFVSKKGLSNKRMVLDAKNGITFLSDKGHVIPLSCLSSGEQNLVILYYRLVFETNNQTLFLMDEPENSLHVEWLQQMLGDYIDMEGILGCQMVIATHSVTFVNGHWDIAYDLDGGSYQD